VSKIAHLAKAESEILRGAGIVLGGLAGRVLQELPHRPGRRSHDLDCLPSTCWGHPARARAMLGKGKTAQARETIEPAAVLAQLAEELAPSSIFASASRPGSGGRSDQSLRLHRASLVRVLVDMEWTGITIDAGVQGRRGTCSTISSGCVGDRCRGRGRNQPQQPEAACGGAV
jgi:hypothetical protein